MRTSEDGTSDRYPGYGPGYRLSCSASWPRSVTSAARAPRSGTPAATPWWPPSGASTRTCRRSGSSRRARRRAPTSAPAASRPARSPRPSKPGLSGVAYDTNLGRFRAVVAAALAHLEARRQEVNDLNVFPVADGDTGDNMALTLRAVLAELDRLVEEQKERTLDEIGREEIVDAVARAALL